jgi:hypothetical protein
MRPFLLSFPVAVKTCLFSFSRRLRSRVTSSTGTNPGSKQQFLQLTIFLRGLLAARPPHPAPWPVERRASLDDLWAPPSPAWGEGICGLPSRIDFSRSVTAATSSGGANCSNVIRAASISCRAPPGTPQVAATGPQTGDSRVQISCIRSFGARSGRRRRSCGRRRGLHDTAIADRGGLRQGWVLKSHGGATINQAYPDRCRAKHRASSPA